MRRGKVDRNTVEKEAIKDEIVQKESVEKAAVDKDGVGRDVVGKTPIEKDTIENKTFKLLIALLRLAVRITSPQDPGNLSMMDGMLAMPTLATLSTRDIDLPRSANSEKSLVKIFWVRQALRELEGIGTEYLDMRPNLRRLTLKEDSAPRWN
ncbi:hypothetical protein BGW39_008480 [Mortierella sp. 14UC]|nr:hypothetical protein BGW39_008480 [Mortierella sp. 14UC]